MLDCPLSPFGSMTTGSTHYATHTGVTSHHRQHRHADEAQAPTVSRSASRTTSTVSRTASRTTSTAPSPEHEMTQAGVDHDEDDTGATPTDATSSTGGFLYNRMNSNECRDLEHMHRLLHLGRTAPEEPTSHLVVLALLLRTRMLRVAGCHTGIRKSDGLARKLQLIVHHLDPDPHAVEHNPFTTATHAELLDYLAYALHMYTLLIENP